MWLEKLLILMNPRALILKNLCNNTRKTLLTGSGNNKTYRSKGDGYMLDKFLKNPKQETLGNYLLQPTGLIMSDSFVIR